MIGAVVLTWWLGAYALAFGVALLVLAFRLRARKDDTRARPRAAGVTMPDRPAARPET